MSRVARHLSHEEALQLTLDTEPWLSCDDCFELMDRYVESALADPGTSDFREMRVHLSGCAACAEEAESLMELVRGDRRPPQPEGH